MSFLLLLLLYPVCLHSLEICSLHETFHCKQFNRDKNDTCRVTVGNSTPSCQSLDYPGVDNLKHSFGEVFLEVKSDLQHTFLFLRIYPSVQWDEALIKISEYENLKSCETFAVTRNDYLVDILKYDCRLKDQNESRRPLLLEIHSENDGQYAQKKILFNPPDPVSFRYGTPSSRQIFSYIDFTSSSKIVLKIQPLPENFKVTHYKVEVFREKEKNAILLDVRLIPAAQKRSLDFEYVTYSEEGYYYFAVSEISAYCPEDQCYKTLTPKLHIARKKTPLVIGIVSASFLIPFVLFTFYYWNHKYRNQGLFLSEPIKKVIVLFKPSFEKHNDVVSSIIEAIETLSEPSVIVDRINLTKVKEKTVEKFCSDNLILATHIIYINPPYIDDESSGLDYMTFNFLKEETKKVTTNRKLIVIRLPYSKMETPSILSRATHVELIKDFEEFINKFSSVATYADYSRSPIYTGLAKRIGVAELEVESFKKVPEIIVSDETEDANEVDGLIND